MNHCRMCHVKKNNVRKNRVKNAGLLACMLILALLGQNVTAQDQFLPPPIPPSGGYAPGEHQYAKPEAQYSRATTPTYPTTQYQVPQQQVTQLPAAPYPNRQLPNARTSPAANHDYSVGAANRNAPYPTTPYQASPYQATAPYQTQYQAAPYPNTQLPNAGTSPAANRNTSQTMAASGNVGNAYQAAPYPTAQPVQPYQQQQQQTYPAPYQTPQYQTPQYQVAQQPTAPYPATTQPYTNTQLSNAGTSPAANANYDYRAGTYPQSNQVQQTRYIQPSMPTVRQPALRPTPSYNSTPNRMPSSSKLENASTLTGSIEGKTVVDIRIVGNRSIKKERITSMIRTRKGREFKNETVQRDVREMSRSGLFVDVKPSYQETPDGPIVIFEVLERPILDAITFHGARAIKPKTLLKESGLKEGDAADPFKVGEARRSLEYFYHDKGYAKARVTIHKGNKPGDREAIFIINEGTKKKILWTKFEGNSVANDSRLKTQIESKEGILWFVNGEFNREKIKADEKTLQAYYRGLGFFDAKVGSEVVFTFDNWATVTFVINEGPRYKVRDIRFIGNDIYREGQLKDELKLLTGKYFNQKSMSADVRAIQERYGRVGHVFADIKAEPRFLEEPGTLDLVYNIKEGEQYRVGRIDIKIKGEGEISRTRNTVVLTRTSLVPGDVIDTQKIRDTKRRLQASGVFNTNPAMGSAPEVLISPPKDLGPEDLRGSSPQARGQNW